MTRVRRGSAFLGCAVVAACALGLAAPASADDDGNAILAKMQAAMRSASSFTARFEPTLVMNWTVVQPDRMRRFMISGDKTGRPQQWILIGHASYGRDGDAPWEAEWHAGDAIRWTEFAAFLRDGTTARALPDRKDHGTVVGALDVLVPAVPNAATPSRPFHETCTYDKATYYPRACTSRTIAGIDVTTTYEHWNDPSNTVEPPPGIALPTPLPSPPSRGTRR